MTTETGHPLCVDNWGDYMLWDYPISLAKDADHEILPDSPLVDKLLRQVERADGEYRIGREEAAAVLNAAREMA